MSGHKPTAATPNRLDSIQVQSSSAGQVIPIVWGTTRIACNLIGYYDFASTAQKTQASGKGGGSVTTGYNYTATVLLGLCEGPIQDITRTWQGQKAYAMSTAQQVTNAGYGALSNYLNALPQDTNWSKFVGYAEPTPWSYMTSKHPDQALAYSHTAYLGATNFDLGGSAAMPNNTFEIVSPFIVPGTLDANPRDVILDFLTNTIYGVPGWESARIADMGPYSEYCLANNILISPALDQQTTASQFLQDIVDATNSVAFWSEGKLKVVPRGDSPATGNGATYTPNTTALYDLNDDHFLTDNGQDAVRLVRTRPADAYNRFPVEFLDRSNNYNISIAEARDSGSVYLYGHRKASPKQLHMICDANIAQLVAQIEMQRQLYVRNTYEFDLPWNFCLLEPGDLVTLTDEKLGLDFDAVMITGIEENADDQLTVTAEEWPFGVNSHHATAPSTNSGYTPQTAVDPGNAAAPVIFQLPVALTKPSNTLALATSGGANWGGCDVYVSEDGNTYKQIGTIKNKARYGVATQALNAGADPDTTDLVSVDLSLSGGTLTSGTQADADNFNTLCYIDGEFISYETATLTAPNQYNLSYLRRGVYGSPNIGHAAGVDFVRCDDALFKYNLPNSLIGKPLWFKLVSFNIYGNAYQSLADVNPINFTPYGNKPASLTGLTTTGTLFGIDIDWTFALGAHDLDYTEIVYGVANDRSQAVTLTDEKYPVQKFTQAGLDLTAAFFYWARVIDTARNASDWYPPDALAGVHGKPTSDPAQILQILDNQITSSQLATDLQQQISLAATSNGTIVDQIEQVAQDAETAASALIQNILDMNDRWNTQRNQGTTITNLSSTVDANSASFNDWVQTQTTTNQSVATQITTLQGNVGTNSAAITNIESLTVDTSSALMQKFSSLDASIGSNSGAIQNIESLSLDASTALMTEFNNMNASIGTNSAAITNIENLTLGADTALMTQINNLSASVNSNSGAINNIESLNISSTTALASKLSTLTTSVNGNTSSIQSIETVQNGLTAEYMLKTDVNGHVAGFGLYNTGKTSDFIVNVSNFAVGNGGSDGYPFMVGTVNGVQTVAMKSAFIQDASVNYLMVENNAVTIPQTWNFSNPASGGQLTENGSGGFTGALATACTASYTVQYSSTMVQILIFAKQANGSLTSTTGGWEAQLYVDGSLVNSAGGYQWVDNWTISYGIMLSPGSHTIVLDWGGCSGSSLTFVSIVALGCVTNGIKLS